MKEMTFEIILKKLVTRHSPHQETCLKCKNVEEVYLALNCSKCGNDFILNKNKILFSFDIIKGFIFKYSNTNLNKEVDKKLFSLIDDIKVELENNKNLSTDKNMQTILKMFFNFLLENKIILGNPSFNICVLPDFTLFFNHQKLAEIEEHFGSIEYSLPFFIGSFAYISEYRDYLTPSMWGRIKKIF